MYRIRGAENVIVVGICGGSGSGKSTVCDVWISYGAVCYSADEAYHRLIASDTDCARDLISAFGDTIRQAGGGINRRALAALVFSADFCAKERLAALNRIAHRHVEADFLEWLERMRACRARFALLDAPMLFEAGMEQYCDVTVAVIAPLQMRLNRIVHRDSIGEEEAMSRLRSQTPDEVLIERADYVIDNAGTIEDLLADVDRLAKTIGNKGEYNDE